ncbi:MAG: hypothetical protein ACI9U0_002288 [Flavobacteriales bacterium]|jgi:hypothetical protein
MHVPLALPTSGHRIVIPVVEGSSPFSHPIFYFSLK